MARAYRCRASDLYGLQDPVTAWAFDRAVYRLGSRIDAELAEAGKGAKSKPQAEGRRQRVLAKYLGTDVKYKDPVSGTPGGASSTEAGPVQL